MKEHPTEIIVIDNNRVVIDGKTKRRSPRQAARLIKQQAALGNQNFRNGKRARKAVFKAAMDEILGNKK